MENMELWNKVCRVPENFLRKITAGRLKGKSDISPQWRMMALTETYGPYGFGWKYTVDKLWTEPADNGQVFAFAMVSLYVKHESTWSEPSPGTGGSMLIVKETAGLHSNDEAYKMAVTDAIGVAAKAFGVAADIYLGLFDGSKYNTSPTNEQSQQPPSGRRPPANRTPTSNTTQPASTTPPQTAANAGRRPLTRQRNRTPSQPESQPRGSTFVQQEGKITQVEYDELKRLVGAAGITTKEWRDYLDKFYSVGGAAELTMEQYTELVGIIKTNPIQIKEGLAF